MKARHFIILVILGLFGACSYRFLGGLRTDIYHGQVVDAESGKAIPEAVVAVVWTRATIGIDSHGLSVLKAQEALTNVNGGFSMTVSSGLDWNPLSTRVDEPSIVIYKPGYEPLWAGTEIRYGFRGNELVESLKRGVTIKLRTREAAKLSEVEYTHEGTVLPGTSVVYDRIPNLMRAIDSQRKMAGLQPLLP